MELGNIKQLWKKIEEITKTPTMLRNGSSILPWYKLPEDLTHNEAHW